MRVWLDDRRPAPPGWVHVTTPEQAIELLRGGAVEELSLDHDLGLDVGPHERTGYDVLLWLEAEVEAGREVPPAVMTVHSGNVAAIGPLASPNSRAGCRGTDIVSASTSTRRDFPAYDNSYSFGASKR